ncbi:MAG: hypothetical protein HC767_06385 [Akkermansiaceae bacterium]|nr:hypothetical protein [Akkermansiaceae bacterium]
MPTKSNVTTVGLSGTFRPNAPRINASTEERKDFLGAPARLGCGGRRYWMGLVFLPGLGNRLHGGAGTGIQTVLLVILDHMVQTGS